MRSSLPETKILGGRLQKKEVGPKNLKKIARRRMGRAA
jgi:hypothetical protein